MAELLTRPPLPTAIVAADAPLGLGAWYALAGRGMMVPQEMSIIAIHKLPLEEYRVPALTCIQLPAPGGRPARRGAGPGHPAGRAHPRADHGGDRALRGRDGGAAPGVGFASGRGGECRAVVRLVRPFATGGRNDDRQAPRSSTWPLRGARGRGPRPGFLDAAGQIGPFRVLPLWGGRPTARFAADLDARRSSRSDHCAAVAAIGVDRGRGCSRVMQQPLTHPPAVVSCRHGINPPRSGQAMVLKYPLTVRTAASGRTMPLAHGGEAAEQACWRPGRRR